jgi:hypothetical protein
MKSDSGTVGCRLKITALFVVLLLVGVFAPVHAQNHVLKALVFIPVDTTDTEESAPYRDALRDALHKRLSEDGFETVSRDILDGDTTFRSLTGLDPAKAEAVLPAAKSLGADTAAVSTFGLEGRRLFIQIKIYDVRTSKVVAATADSGYAGLAGFGLVEDTVDLLRPEIAAYVETYDPDEPITYEAVAGVVFTSMDEGMEVAYETGDPVGAVKAGGLETPYVPFIVGTEIQVWKTKAGYYPDSETIIFQEGFNTIGLRPLKKRYRNEVSGYWTLGQSLGAGLGYRFYVDPDFVFFGVDDHFSVQHDLEADSTSVLHNDASFSFGGYLFSSYDKRLRVGASLGFGVIITSFTAADMPVYTDYYLNYFSPFIDLNFRPWTFFVQGAFRYSLGMGNDFLGREHLFIKNIGLPLSLGVRKKW